MLVGLISETLISVMVCRLQAIAWTNIDILSIRLDH